jgi:DNA-binding CsgD family transcriptional regulator
MLLSVPAPKRSLWHSVKNSYQRPVNSHVSIEEPLGPLASVQMSIRQVFTLGWLLTSRYPTSISSQLTYCYDLHRRAGRTLCRAGCCCDRLHLTRQQLATIELVAAGLTNEGVCHRLHLSGHTVATHVADAMHLVNAHSRAELVARAYSLNMLDPLAWPPRLTGQRCVSGAPALAHAETQQTSIRSRSPDGKGLWTATSWGTANWPLTD